MQLLVGRHRIREVQQIVINWCRWIGHRYVEVRTTILDEEPEVEWICRRCGKSPSQEEIWHQWGM